MKIYVFMGGMVGFAAFGLQAVLLNLYLVHLGFDTTFLVAFFWPGRGRGRFFPDVAHGDCTASHAQPVWPGTGRNSVG